MMVSSIFSIICLFALLFVTANSNAPKHTKHSHKHHRNHYHHGGKTMNDNDVPDAWDWRSYNCVSKVMDQFQSGNTFATDVADSVNSYRCINGGWGRLASTSAQELIDCCTTEPASVNIYQCIVRLDGICSSYDYKPLPSGQCNAANCRQDTKVKIYGGYAVISKNETDLKVSVYKNPAVVLIDASRPSFQAYQSGVYDEANCSTDNLDHALLVVGYGQTDGVDVWICKNTWGVNWGVQGYIYIARGKNICGIAANAMIPV